jgi:hypothetical protein
MTDSFTIWTVSCKGKMTNFIEISINEFMIESFGPVNYWTFINVFGNIMERAFLIVKN